MPHSKAIPYDYSIKQPRPTTLRLVAPGGTSGGNSLLTGWPSPGKLGGGALGGGPKFPVCPEGM